MFVSEKSFNWKLENIDRAILDLESRYWKLLDKHNMLLNHLGLTEVDVPSKTMLIEKKQMGT